MYEESQPPGVCVDRNVHGPQVPIRRPKSGLDRLRDMLGVTGDVPIDQLCGDAAAEIAELRGVVELFERDGPQAFVEPVKRGRGRPRKQAFADV